MALLDGTNCAANDVVRTDRLRSLGVPARWIDVREESGASNAEVRCGARRLDEKVDAESVDARHRRDRFSLPTTVAHEDRPNQIVDAQLVLRDQAPRPSVEAVAAHAHVWERTLRGVDQDAAGVVGVGRGITHNAS